MNNKLPMAFRMIFGVAFLIVISGLLTTTPVQSADPLAIDATITVDPTTGLVTTEAAVQDTFTVTLSQEPIATVTVNLTSSNLDEGTVSPPSAVFNNGAGNWDAVTVTVTGVDDFVDDGNVGYTITTSAAVSTDPAYTGLNPENVSVTNNDNDTAGFDVVPLTTMETTELGDTASFTVALSSQPTDTVTVALASDTPGEGIVTLPLTPILTFTTGTWNTPQPVTVTGQNDFVVDGDIPYNIILDPASVGDTNYNSLANVPVAVTNIDNDISGLTVVTTPPMQTTEAGGTASFTVALSSQPSADVTVAVSSSNINEGIVSAPPIIPLTFTTVNWNIPQPVTVTGVDDLTVDNIVAYNIVLNPASLGDPLFDVLPNVNVGVTNIDRLTVFNTPPWYTTEGGGTAKFDVALSSQPTSSVTVSLSSDTLTEGTITEPVSSSLNFTTLNWNTPQTITVTGVDDCVNDGDISYKLTFNSSSSDSVYTKIESLNLINYDAPTIDWVEPVGTEGIYFADGLNPINLEVVNICPAEPISKVRFYRYVPPPNEDWITIGEDDKPPYRDVIQPDELEPGWNQVFAFAFGPPNPIQTTSKHLRILILDEIGALIFLPLMNR